MYDPQKNIKEYQHLKNTTEVPTLLSAGKPGVAGRLLSLLTPDSGVLLNLLTLGVLTDVDLGVPLGVPEEGGSLGDLEVRDGLTCFGVKAFSCGECFNNKSQIKVNINQLKKNTHYKGIHQLLLPNHFINYVLVHQ